MAQLTEAPSPDQKPAVDRELSRRDLMATVVAAFSFGVSLPLIDLLRHDVAFFVVRSSPALDYFVFVGVVAVLAPAGLAAVVISVPRSWKGAVHGLVFGGLVTVLGLRLVKRVALLDHAPPAATLALAIAVGVLGVVAVRRSGSVRLLCRYAALLPLALTGLFFASAPVRAAMAPPEWSATTTVTGYQTVVFVLLDELPVISLMDGTGNLNRIRYPGFARLAEQSTWFRNASTGSTSTIDAVPSVLTGRYPAPGGETVPTLNAHPRNLFTMFASSHDVVAAEPITRLCPDAVCGSNPGERVWDRYRVLASDVGIVTLHTLLPTSLTRQLPPIDEDWGYFGSASPGRSQFQEGITPLLRTERVTAFEEFVGGIEAESGPTVYFIHSLLPHRPWTHVPSGETYLQIERVPGISSGVWDEKDWLVDQGLQRQLLQVGTADMLVGQLLDRLQEIDPHGEVILIVTADHGIAFQASEALRGVHDSTLGALVPVPLFVTIPGKEGSVVDDPVELIDVLPTIAQLVGADSRDWSFDGVSLMATPQERERVVITGGSRKPLKDLENRRDQELRSLNQRVPLSGDWNALFHAGHGKHLLGSALVDLQVGAPTGWTARVDDLEHHSRLDLADQAWPLMVTGHLEGNPRRVPVDLAIAVNGQISAVTRTFDQARGSMFSALTRLEDLKEGRRDLAIFVVEGLGFEDVLLPLDIAPVDD